MSQAELGDYYSEVNFCSDDSTGEQCQCFYKKVEYGSSALTKYHNRDTAPGQSVCVTVKGDHKIGASCDSTNPTEDQCGLGTKDQLETYKNGCESISKNTTYYGQRNFCLEPDPTKLDKINACLTWWPGGGSIGDPDIYNLYTSAGYFAADNRQWYCVGQGTPPKIENVGVFPDKDDSDHIRTHTYIVPNDVRNPYGKAYWINQKPPVDLSYTYGVEGNFIGTQNAKSFTCSDGKYPCHVPNLTGHTGLENITLGTIDKIRTRLCVDWGGKSTSPGDCNDVEHIWYDDFSWNGSDNCYEKKVSDCTGQDNEDSFQINVCFYGSNSEDKIKDVEIKVHEGGCVNQVLSAIVEALEFDFKNGCTRLIKINPSDNMAQAYTNRVNNIKDFYSSNIEGKTYENSCKPWGSIARSTMDQTIFIPAVNNSTTCAQHQIYSGSIYSSDNSGSGIRTSLFGKIYQSFNYSFDNYSYQSDGTWDETGSSSPSFAPKVAAVCFNTQSGSPSACRENGNLVTNSITIGNIYNQNIESRKSFAAVAKFYAWADTNQMPIREVWVDWGDQTGIRGSGSMIAKNHKDVCALTCFFGNGQTVGKCIGGSHNDNSCAGNGDCPNDGTCDLTPIVCSNVNDCPRGPGQKVCGSFGDSADACVEQYWQFSHVYTCSNDSSAGWEQFDCKDACCFKPKVYVKDNWAWCNGDQSKCPGGGKCYAGDSSCKDIKVGDTSVAGTSFAGTIIVKP